MKLLEGIRILDLSRLLPGPYATMLLADLGAEVIKIETPGLGDYARLIPPFIREPRTGEETGSVFVAVNRNKKSVALNFRHARGKEILMRLARTADVLLEGFRPGAADKWGIGYAAMRAVNSRLVYCSLSGYGQTGPYRDRAGHDLNYVALTGLLAANGAADGPPIPPAVQVADLSGGMLAALSILAALVSRANTGVGQYLDVSLFEGALSWTGTIIGGTFAAGKPVERGKMQLNGGMACYNVYATKDGKYLTLGAIEPHFWAAICKAIQREDLLDRAYEFDAIPEVAATIRTRTLDEWLEVFDEVDACVEPVCDFGTVFENPQVQQRGLVAEIGGVSQVASVFAFADKAYTPPPRQGEHTREVLARVGLSEEEIVELEEKQIIKSAVGPRTADSGQ